MGFETVEGHTFVPGIMERGGYVLDVGCRSFEFSEHFAARGFRVLALDPDPAIRDPEIPSVEFLRLALVHDRRETASYFTWEDPNWSPPTNGSLLSYYDPGRFAPDDPAHREPLEVPCCDLLGIMRRYGVERFELVKLGCEGSEYEILRHWPGPVAKQISVEFHDWAGANPADARPNAPCDSPALLGFYETLFADLDRWYELVLHETDCLFDPSDDWRGYMDSVLVLKSLAETRHFLSRTQLAKRISNWASELRLLRHKRRH